MESEGEDFVNTQFSEAKVWLVKVPEFLFHRISCIKGGGSGAKVGHLRVAEKGSGEHVRLTFHLDEDIASRDVPADYEIRFFRNPRPSYIFSEREGEAVAIDGFVERECHMRPIDSGLYRTAPGGRDAAPASKIQVIDTKIDGGLVNRFPHVSDAYLLSKKKKILSSDLKRERLQKAALFDVLFMLFERQKHWTLRDLIHRTQQPSAYIKNVLSEIAVYNKRGEYKATYCLKSEYEQISGRKASEDGAESSDQDV